MRSRLKKVPRFKNEREEFEFWSTHDSTEYIDYSKAKRILGWSPEVFLNKGIEITYNYFYNEKYKDLS